jgi:uncharacterized membrane protein
MPAEPREIELRGALSRTLSAGVLLSGASIGIGLALSALGRSRGEAWLLFGIVALVATPYLRVAQLAAAFARRREWRFLALSLTVLLLMTFGAFLGAQG